MAQRILIVDDDAEIVRLIRSYLERAGFQVLVAYDGTTALHVIRRERPDLVLLDLMLPERDGWAITRTLRSDETLVKLPIIMLTARIEDTDRIVGLELGADDYITKPFNPHEVVARVRAVLRRSTDGPALPTLMQVGRLQLDPVSYRATLKGQILDLTPTEFKLLKLFMENPGRVLTREELIEQGLGYAYAGMDRTVDSHVKNLRKKLEADPTNPQYIQTVYGIGYRMQDE